MTKEQWIAKYEQKAEPFSMTPGYNLWFRANKGFFLWKAQDGVLGISHTSTNDIQFMLGKMMEIAKRNNCTLLRTATIHNPASFMRLMGSHLNLERSDWHNGRFYWFMEREVI